MGAHTESHPSWSCHTWSRHPWTCHSRTWRGIFQCAQEPLGRDTKDRERSFIFCPFCCTISNSRYLKQSGYKLFLFCVSETPGHGSGWAETPRTDRGDESVGETPTPGASKRKSRWDETPASQMGSSTPLLTPGKTPLGTPAMNMATPTPGTGPILLFICIVVEFNDVFCINLWTCCKFLYVCRPPDEHDSRTAAGLALGARD